MPSNRPRLTRADRAFLAAHNIPAEYVADMRDRADWANCSDELRQLCCYFAWGFRTCDFGHRLTNSKGRCIQCHTSTIAFVLRHTRSGWLYIAEADGKQLTKVGVASDVQSRLAQLNAHRLDGVSFWRVIYTDFCKNPAALEAELHRHLADYRRDLRYDRKGGQVSREVFACAPATALDALAEIYHEIPDW